MGLGMDGQWDHQGSGQTAGQAGQQGPGSAHGGRRAHCRETLKEDSPEWPVLPIQEKEDGRPSCPMRPRNLLYGASNGKTVRKKPITNQTRAASLGGSEREDQDNRTNR